MSRLLTRDELAAIRTTKARDLGNTAWAALMKE